MITVKGYHYFNDNNMPQFTKQFENVGQLMYHIQQNALGKKKVFLPSQEDDGSFKQMYAGAMCGCLRYDDEVRSNGDASMCVELVSDEDGKILFSSGSRTDGRGHISTAMKDALKNLKAWKDAEYEFAD